MKKYIQSLTVFILLSFNFNISLAAEGAGILSNEDSLAADPEALLAEVAVFKSIREGLTLSFATCDITNSCNPVATDDEIQQLISALDQRIDGLSQRQQNAEEPGGLEDVLIAYFDEREGYALFLAKLGSIAESRTVMGADIDDAELFGDEEPAETSEAATENIEQFDMFADEDEEL